MTIFLRVRGNLYVYYATKDMIASHIKYKRIVNYVIKLFTLTHARKLIQGFFHKW